MNIFKNYDFMKMTGGFVIGISSAGLILGIIEKDLFRLITSPLMIIYGITLCVFGVYSSKNIRG